MGGSLEVWFPLLANSYERGAEKGTFGVASQRILDSLQTTESSRGNPDMLNCASSIAIVIALSISTPPLGQGAAKEAPTTTTESVWEIPDLRGLNPERAIDAVLATTRTVDELDIRIVNRKNSQKATNLTNWEVCAQSPQPGREISKATKRITLYVRRPNSSGC